MDGKTKLTLITGLNAEESNLLERAVRTAEKSYSPYSGITVGAAVATPDGEVFVGTNVENSSYGLTLCAERAAVAAAVAGGKRRFSLLAIACPQLDGIVPCGACLQVLAEFSSDLRILMKPATGEVFEAHLSALLPEGFALRSGGEGER